MLLTLTAAERRGLDPTANKTVVSFPSDDRYSWDGDVFEEMYRKIKSLAMRLRRSCLATTDEGLMLVVPDK
jgi:hypothetical protein